MTASEIQKSKPSKFSSSLTDPSEEDIEFLRLFDQHFQVHGVLDEENESEGDGSEIAYQYLISPELYEFFMSKDGAAMRRFLKDSKQ